MRSSQIFKMYSLSFPPGFVFRDERVPVPLQQVLEETVLEPGKGQGLGPFRHTQIRHRGQPLPWRCLLVKIFRVC